MAAKPLSEIVAAKQRVEGELLGHPGVTGVDVGYKYVGGNLTDDLAIRVMVERKKTSVPQDQKVPSAIDGVKTDVIERTFFLHAPRNRRPVDEIDLQTDNGTYDPLMGGVSIGPVRPIDGQIWAGTLGAIVHDNKSGTPLLLSNFHVLAIDQDARTGDAIAQPSLVDGGRDPQSVVGALERTALTATVDGALATLQGRSYSAGIVDIGAITGTGEATPGMAVRKRGRTTGVTYGIIDGISLSVTLPYPGGVGPKTLTDQIDVRPDSARNAQFADHGDSGAVLVDDNGKIIGLHFAGSNDGHGVANPIADVLSALDVRIEAGAVKQPADAGAKNPKLETFEKLQVKEKTEKLEVKEGEKFIFEGKALSEKFANEGLVQPAMPGQPMEAQLKNPKELKIEIKDGKNELKDHKDHIKEFKEKNDSKEHKEFKFELKEHSKVELEKPFRETVKELVEGSPKFAEGDPLQQIGPGIANAGLQGASANFKITDKVKDLVDKRPVEKFHKDFDKTHKDIDKIIKDKDLDKQIFEGGGKQIAENVDPFQVGAPQLQAAGAAAKQVDKIVEHKINIKSETKDHKLENKEFKNEKIEGKDKLEIKDHKPELKDKPEIKELKGEKDFKIENKEHGKIEIIENQKQIFEGGGKINEGGDPFQIGQAVNPALQAASASAASALKHKDIEKIKPEKEFDKIHVDKVKWEKDIEKIKPEKEFSKDFTKDFQLDKHKTEFEKLIPENPKQLVEGGPQLPQGGDPVKAGTPAPGLQGASEPKDDSKKEGGAAAQAGGATQAAGSGAAAAQKFPKVELEKQDKFPKFEFEKHDKFPKIEFEKHPKLELEKIKFENEKTKFEKEKEIIFDKGKNEFEKIFQEGPKTIAEGGPGFPNQPDPASRIAQLEAAVAQLSTFIPQHLRPDLSGGALTNEPDQKSEQKGEAKAEQKAESKSESKSDPKRKRS